MRSLGWAIGKNFFSLSGPVAVYRNRVPSIRDLQAGGPGGVGGLANFVIMTSYTRRF